LPARFRGGRLGNLAALCDAGETVLAGVRTTGASIRLPNPRLLALAAAVVIAVVWARSIADRVANSLGNGIGRAVFVLTPTPEKDPVASGAADVLAIVDMPVEEVDEASDTEVDDAETSVQGKTGTRHKKKAVVPRHSVFIPAGAVLRLANAGARPSALPVKPKGGRPAGLALRGVSGLGVGMRDGDVLTRVAGQPVQSVAEVVSIVLVLRSKLAPRIDAVFWRGGAPWTLVVEQPYIADPPAQAVP
jgi:hypothetical protein